MAVTPQVLGSLLQDSLSTDSQRVAEAGEAILLLQKDEDFLPVSFFVATSPDVEAPVAVRGASAVQFLRALRERAGSLDPSLVLRMLSTIPGAAVAAAGAGRPVVSRQLLESFSLLLPAFSTRYTVYQGVDPCGFFLELYRTILAGVDQTNMEKTKVVINLVTTLISGSAEEAFRPAHDQICKSFYTECLQHLLAYLISLGSELGRVVSPEFIASCLHCLNSFFQPVAVIDIWVSPEFAGLCGTVSAIFQSIGLGEGSVDMLEAKDIAATILLKYTMQAKAVMQNPSCFRMIGINRGEAGSGGPDPGQRFLEMWQSTQVEIANSLLKEFSICPQYNLWEDHRSIESVFSLALALFAKNLYNSWQHPAAAEILVAHDLDIYRSILQMIYNAAILRLQAFVREDLLIIDCLKGALDFIRALACYSPAVGAKVAEDIDQRVAPLLQYFAAFQANDQAQTAALGNLLSQQDAQAGIFQGLILVRRGLPNVEGRNKGRIVFAGISAHQHLHEIVFEELAKLVIAVTQEDYVTENFRAPEIPAGLEGEDLTRRLLTEGMHCCELDTDFVPCLVYALVRLYLSDDCTFFEGRMLTGTLARCVRSNMLSVELTAQMTLKSLVLIAQSPDSASAGGMTTFVRVVCETTANKILIDVLLQFLETPTIASIFDGYNACSVGRAELGQVRRMVETVNSTIALIFGSLETATDRLERKLVEYVTRVLQADIAPSGTLFGILDNFFQKTMTQDPRDPLAEQGLPPQGPDQNPFSALVTSAPAAQALQTREFFLQGLGIMTENVRQFQAAPNMFIRGGKCAVEDLVSDGLGYLLYLVPRHLAAAKADHPARPLDALLSYISALMQKSVSPVLVVSAAVLLSRLLDNAAALDDQSLYSLLVGKTLELFGPVFLDLQAFSRAMLVHNLSPDLKRWLFLSLAMLLFTLLGASARMHLETVPGFCAELAKIPQATYVVLAFIATWGMQDIMDGRGSAAGFSSIRVWLAFYAFLARPWLADLAAGTLGASPLQNPRLVVYPLLCWTFTTMLADLYRAPTPPRMDFNGVCATGVSMDALSDIFLNMASAYTKISTVTSNNLLPMYEGFISTPFRPLFDQLRTGILACSQGDDRLFQVDSMTQFRSMLSELDMTGLDSRFQEWQAETFHAQVMGADLLAQSIGKL